MAMRTLAVIITTLFLATGTAHAEDALVVSRGVEWKCPDGIIIRFDSIGGRYEEGASTTLTIMGLSRLGPNTARAPMGPPWARSGLLSRVVCFAPKVTGQW